VWPEQEEAMVEGRKDEVSYISGRTRVFGIVGHPIEQVRSPQMVTAELTQRGQDAILIPIHILPDDFGSCLPQIMRIQNLDGLIFTIPFKQAACGVADEIGAQGRAVGAINALARRGDGRWIGDMFDGLGCVEAFRRRGFSFAGRRVCLIGAGGAGSAIAAAVAHERPASLRLFDLDATRVAALADVARQISPDTAVEIGPPVVEGVDIFMNASPVGMLSDARLPVEVAAIPAEVIVFDAIVTPEQTPLLALAQTSGCRVVRGREMMLGQIAKIVDFFTAARGSA
jgi:shikimate dehydrogenase